MSQANATDDTRREWSRSSEWLPDSIADELPDDCARNRVRRYVMEIGRASCRERVSSPV